jgi:hypothetical protein
MTGLDRIEEQYNRKWGELSPDSGCKVCNGTDWIASGKSRLKDTLMTKDERLVCLDHCERYAKTALDEAKKLTKKKPAEALYHIADAMMALKTADHHHAMLKKQEMDKSLEDG